ncbi:4'-phosphopantetheinyl transferase family protein [Actinomadura rugatobispora]|uniref:4'-phosphopantetheinyl transferase n=1 Tax=Actinomadura rugatobispora TaxID=1994 RepID=A0ABW1AK49_9ACTN|nr:4'-phosphopantetheinyl transferase superfamily protein [Actinomadura rugatobispora]
MIERILPAGVVTASAYDDPAEAKLLPEEEPAVARAVDKRRREFTTVRWCARRALAGLGLPPVPITRGDKGAPRWPDGVVGSMTHCDGYRAAAVARAADLAALGIDAEPHGPLPDGVLEAVAREEELAMLDGLGRTAPGVHWDRLLFSAKESVYKAWFPVTGRWLGFEDASLTFDPGGTFRAAILVGDSPFASFDGRWAAGGGLAVTAIAVPAG